MNKSIRLTTIVTSGLLLIAFWAFVLVAPSRAAGEVHALFDFHTLAEGPFPSDLFTVSDSSQNTGLRIELPKPDCQIRRSDCEDLDLINTLDGFNLLPRLSIPFDGEIDPSTATSQTVFLISMGSTLPDGNPSGRVVGINRIVWDPLTKTLHAESDELLDQHTRYGLIITNGLRDAQGNPIEASETFEQFRHDLNFGQTRDRDMKDYRKALLDATEAARSTGVQDADIVAASVFTTQSSTATLEKIRDQIKSATPAAADFSLAIDGTRTVFPLETVTGITFNQQIGVAASPTPLNVSLLRIKPGAVGQVAFGKYLSPEYMIRPGDYIPPVTTRSGLPIQQRMNEVYFNLFLPSGPAPASGWPVAIFGHGSAANKNNQPLEVAAIMASHGIATIAISFYGNGFGPLSTLTVNRTGSAPVTLPAGGRGVDQNNDNLIGEGEGRSAAPPRSLISSRDAAQQTIADFMQLVRVIETGMDVDGDGAPDLDPKRIYYFGHSLGGMWGTIFLAIEPGVRAGVLNSVGTPYDNLRLSPPFRAGSIGVPLASRVPSLINSPGLTQVGGVPVGPPFFNENLPLRDQPQLTNTVAGAMDIQEVLDRMKWVTQSASSLACAPYLRKSPLPGVPQKSVLFQFNIGDRIASNPSTTALLRAGELSDRATLFRNDLAFAENVAVPKDPHLLIRNITVPSVAAMAQGIQEQIAVFLASDGLLIIHPQPSRFFEVPVAGPLPEQLNFIP